jgi:hypothetical protein
MLPGITAKRPIHLCFSPFPCLKLERLLPFGRRRARGHGLAEKFPRAIVSRVTDLMPGGIVAKNDFADHALIFGEMSFFDETIIGVVFVLQDKSKLFLWPKNFATKKSSALIQIPSNFFANLAILACGGGDGFVIGRIGFVNGARAISVEDDADANLTVFFLRDRAKGRGGEAEEQGKKEEAHDV